MKQPARLGLASNRRSMLDQHRRCRHFALEAIIATSVAISRNRNLFPVALNQLQPVIVRAAPPNADHLLPFRDQARDLRLIRSGVARPPRIYPLPLRPGGDGRIDSCDRARDPAAFFRGNAVAQNEIRRRVPPAAVVGVQRFVEVPFGEVEPLLGLSLRRRMAAGRRPPRHNRLTRRRDAEKNAAIQPTTHRRPPKDRPHPRKPRQGRARPRHGHCAIIVGSRKTKPLL